MFSKRLFLSIAVFSIFVFCTSTYAIEVINPLSLEGEKRLTSHEDLQVSKVETKLPFRKEVISEDAPNLQNPLDDSEQKILDPVTTIDNTTLKKEPSL